MVNALIIEDEIAARNRLKRLLATTAPEVEVLAELETVDSSVAWLRVHPEPSVIFCDIHLADGSCFEIFRQIKVRCPVIFITAYDQYAIEAFRVNSIDYLLKPIKPEELRRSLDKLHETTTFPDLELILNRLITRPREYTRRFVVKQGQQIRSVDTGEIVLFYAEEGVVFLCSNDGSRHIIDLTLEKLEKQLVPSSFFRINRGQIVSLSGISRMHVYPKGRIKIELKMKQYPECIVAAERATAFREWLGG